MHGAWLIIALCSWLMHSFFYIALHVRVMGIVAHCKYSFPPPTMLERLGSATDAASSLMGLVSMLLLN
jgi:hypothetical protein